MPSRVEAGSHASRRPVSPVREREDSRSRRALQMQDRSYSPSRRTRDDPQARARANSSISPNRDEGRNRSPRAADREPESGSKRPVRDSGEGPK